MTKGHVKLTPENCGHTQGFEQAYNAITTITTHRCKQGCGFWFTMNAAGVPLTRYKNREKEPGKHFVPLSKDGKL